MRHYFECDKHFNELARLVATGVAPLKYAYAGSSSATHTTLANSYDYRSVNWDLHSQSNFINKYFSFNNIDLVEFGPGTGQHTVNILKNTSLKHNIRQYTGIDFSRELFLIARNNIKHEFPDMNVDFWNADVENSFINGFADKYKSCQVFFLCLGVLGNVEDTRLALKNIYKTVPKGSTGLLSVAKYSDNGAVSNYTTPYDNDIFRAAALEPIKSLGVSLSACNMTVEWNQEEQSIEGYATIKEDIHIGLTGKHKLEKDKKIRCFVSRRFGFHEFQSIVTESGFFYVDSDCACNAGTINCVVKKNEK